MDIIAGVIPTIIEYAAAPIIRHISYPFNYKTNVKKLEEKVDELKRAQQSVQRKKLEEIRSGNLIEDYVEKWLVEVDGMVVKESEGIVLDREKAKKKCFWGFCPNLKTRYQVSRKAEKKAGEIVKFKQEREEFSAHFAYPAPPNFIAAFSVGDYMALESRTSISKEIMNALAAADVSTVGVYGDGGVGKTRLAKEVARQAMEEKLIDSATVVTVTLDVNVKNIQEQIADMLGLKLEEESVAGRAGRLFGRLKNEDNAKNEDKAKNDGRILIVFDDLWEKLDLEAIGIPSDMQRCRGCKILLTSRNIDVLKDGMNCQKYFPVRTLDKDEAWGLFQRMAENSFENDDRQSTAEEVAEMCAGLPVAIVTVASTLRNKSLQEWKDALQQLKHPHFEDPSEMQTAIYKPIKFSYDYLRPHELQSTFLLCSQMGYHATTKDLLKYGIGRSLFRNVSKLKEAQDRVFSLVQKLKAVCLLLEGETSEELVMHDVVRVVGRWIAASGEHKVLIVNDENQMKQLVDPEDKLKTYSEIWLSSNIDELPEEIQCPKLALFHVDSKNPTLKIPDKLFIGMRQLTTLSFSGLSFTSLPSSFYSLENLKTLCIHESPELGDVRMVGKLRRLEVLSFVKSMIRHLPIEIGELSKLKLLDLSDCNKLIAIPPSVLSKLSQLEGLHMGNSFDGWGSSEGGVTSANVSELKQLTSLTSLDIGIRDARPISACREIFSNKKLCTYRISIGYFSWENGGNKTSKALKLKFTDDTNDVGMEELGVMELLKESEEVCFDGLKLEALVPGEPFRKLKFIKVSRCTRLKYLFSFFVAQGLSQLLEIEVEECEKIEEIVAEEEASVKRSGACTNKNIVFSQLQSLSLGSLPKFKSFCSKEKLEDPSSTHTTVLDEQILFPNLKELFLKAITCEVLWSGHLQLPTIGISFQKLIELRVTGCRKLKYLFPATLVKCLGGLKKLEMEDCDSMEEVVLVVGRTEEQIVFPSLKELSILYCPALKSFTSSSCEGEILEDENAKQRRPFFDETVAFPNLIQLYIHEIRDIDKIWHRQLAPDSFGKLRELVIYRCDKLRNIFSSNLVEMGRFQNLEKLNVLDCDALEVIFEVDDEGWTRESNHVDRTVLPISFHFKVLYLADLPKLRHIWSFCCKDPSPPGGRGTDPYDFSNLQSVTVKKCKVLENVFPRSIATHLPNLECLRIYGCAVLKEIVAKGGEINNDNAAAAPCFRFPELITVELKRVPKLRRLYPGKHTSEFPKLKVLVTEAKPLFSFSLSHQKAVSNLEELQLDGFNISHKRLKWKKIIQPNLFPRLKLLTLYGFNLVWAGLPTDFVQELHSLKKLSVEYCGFEQLFIGCDCEHICGWEHKDTHVHVSPLLRNLETLQVQRCPSLVHLAPLSSAPSFQNIITLQVVDCDSLITLLFTNPESAAKSLTDDQQEEKEITTTTIIFPNLHCLELVSLENLTCFCSGNYNLNFPSLDQVVVANCPKMRVFSPPELQLSTPKLQHVVYDAFRKKKHWEGNLNSTINHLHTQMVGWNKKLDLKLSEFPQLKQTWHALTFPQKDLLGTLVTLVVDACSLFSNAVPFNLLPFLGNLWELHVRNCDSMETVFILESLNADDHHSLLPSLSELSLRDLPRLTHICNMNPQGILEFRGLQILKIHNCSSLRNVLTPSMAMILIGLENIEIRNCTLLEEIVTKEEKKEGEPAAIHGEGVWVIFPQLRCLILESLPNLISINSGYGILEFSRLEEITIQNCPNLKPSISSILREQVLQNTEVQILQSSSTPNDNKTVLPELKKLGLDWNDTMEEIRHGQLQADFIRKLEVLDITGFPDGYEAFPSLFLERFPNLKNLKISNAHFKEIVICEGTDDEDTNEGGALKKLRELTLSKLPKLLHFANPGSILCSILRSLKSLEVSDCSILGPIVPPTTSFQCLQTLEISRCHQVLHLISSLVAKSLVLLTSMSITECKNIEQVAVDEENEAENEVIFEKLERLELHSLPNLVGFSLWNCAFTFPALEEVCVRECPKMKIFSQGDVRTPKLGRVLLKEGQNKWCWKGSLNATIQKLFTDQVVLQSNLPSLPKQLHMYDETAQPGTLNDQENPTQNENSSTAKNFENGTFFQEQKSPRAIHQDETIPPSSSEQSLTIPAAAVAPKVSSSASTSATKTSHSQPGKSLIDTETCILPQTKEENPTQNQNSSTAKDIESGTFLQVEKGPQAIDQSITVQSVPAAATAVAPKVPSSSSATKTPHSQPVKCLIDTETYILPQTKESKPLQDQAMTSSMIENSGNIPVSLAATTSEPDQRTPHFEEDYLESLIFNLEQLLNPSPALSSSSEPDTHHPSQTIGDNFKLMKCIVTKDLSDVATSDDAIFLLSALKTLKDCPSLTPEELAIIELYIKNFDSLVTNYPFHKQQLGRASALKSSSMEDVKKGMLDLKMEYEEVASEANTLCAEKEALKKRLLEIEDREGKVLEKKGNLYGQLLKGKLETRMNALKEAARLQNEAEDIISTANHQWVKMRSLFP